MNEILIISIFVFWYIGSLIVSENITKENKLGTEMIFFISMLFSPVMGMLIKLIFIKNLKQKNSEL